MEKDRSPLTSLREVDEVAGEEEEEKVEGGEEAVEAKTVEAKETKNNDDNEEAKQIEVNNVKEEEKDDDDEKKDEKTTNNTNSDREFSTSPVPNRTLTPMSFSTNDDFYDKNDPLYLVSGLTNEELKQFIEGTTNQRRDDVITETKFFDGEKNYHFSDIIKEERARITGNSSQSDKTDPRFLCSMTKFYCVQLVGKIRELMKGMEQNEVTREIVLLAEKDLFNDPENFMQPHRDKNTRQSLKREFFNPPEKSLPPCYKKARK